MLVVHLIFFSISSDSGRDILKYVMYCTSSRFTCVYAQICCSNLLLLPYTDQFGGISSLSNAFKKPK